MDQFTTAYIECLLWASTDDNGEPLDKNYTADDFTPEALKSIQEDCADFQKEHAELLAKYYESRNPGDAGHDFFLTRNRHGAGFWDRGLGNLGEDLTVIAHAYGETYFYRTDEGKLAGN